MWIGNGIKARVQNFEQEWSGNCSGHWWLDYIWAEKKGGCSLRETNPVNGEKVECVVEKVRKAYH